MDYYSAHTISCLEHEHRVRSIPRVNEYGFLVTIREPYWVVRQARRFIRTVGNSLIAAGKHLMPKPESIIKICPAETHPVKQAYFIQVIRLTPE